MLRILKLKKLFGKLEEFVYFSNTMSQVYSVIKLLITILLIAHWIGCFWYIIGKTEMDNND